MGKQLKLFSRIGLLSATVALVPQGALAQDQMSGGDTAWIITATALVLFMTMPGLALFYAGLVRSKNVLSVLMQCFGIASLISLIWMVIGYSIAFGDGNPWWGGFGKLFFGVCI